MSRRALSCLIAAFAAVWVGGYAIVTAKMADQGPAIVQDDTSDDDDDLLYEGDDVISEHGKSVDKALLAAKPAFFDLLVFHMYQQEDLGRFEKLIAGAQAHLDTLKKLHRDLDKEMNQPAAVQAPKAPTPAPSAPAPAMPAIRAPTTMAGSMPTPAATMPSVASVPTPTAPAPSMHAPAPMGASASMPAHVATMPSAPVSTPAPSMTAMHAPAPAEVSSMKAPATMPGAIPGSMTSSMTAATPAPSVATTMMSTGTMQTATMPSQMTMTPNSGGMTTMP